jgi:hypothetical protein
MDRGYIKVYRSLRDKGYWSDAEYIHLWIHLLMKASYKQKEYLFNGKIEHLAPGQFISGRKSLSKETGVNESKIERILKCFEIEHQIEQQTNNKFRIITILNWDKYQVREQQNEQQMNSQRTASEQPVNTKKKDKKEKKVNKEGTTLPDDFKISDRVLKWAEKKNLNHLSDHFENFVMTCRAKGYKYIDWDAAFMKAVLGNWAKIVDTKPKSDPFKD